MTIRVRNRTRTWDRHGNDRGRLCIGRNTGRSRQRRNGGSFTEVEEEEKEEVFGLETGLLKEREEAPGTGGGGRPTHTQEMV